MLEDTKNQDVQLQKYRRINLLYGVWVVALLGLVLLALNLNGSSSQFFGIAGSREQTISYQYPVEVLSVPIVEGEHVSENDVLLEVRRPDLRAKQAVLADNILELQARNSQSIADKKAKLVSLRSQQQAKLAEIDTKIKSLQSQYSLNLQLLSEISGSNAGNINSASSPVNVKLSGLRMERDHIEKSLQAKIDNLVEQLKSDSRPVISQISELEGRKGELQRQADNLVVKAKFSGSVGSVLYKPGEQVAPFKPIITLHSLSPNFIKGYIHETVLNTIRVNDNVWVKSHTAENNNAMVVAVVESLGRRIVEFPERLKRNRWVTAWGREVIIRLPEESRLLLGEKVVVSLNPSYSMGGWLTLALEKINQVFPPLSAAEYPGGGSAFVGETPQLITSSREINYSENIEASGLVWSEPTNSYFVVSDETSSATPVVFQMNSEGDVIATLPITGIGEIDDMESISSDGHYVYIACSLSTNKQGKHKLKRQKFVRLLLKDQRLSVDAAVDLYDVLSAYSQRGDVDPVLAMFIATAIDNKSLDIEAHSVIGNTLYLGVKKPLNDEGRSVILAFTDVNALFSKGKSNIKLWKSIDLSDPLTRQPGFMSDMLLIDNKLLLLSVADKIRGEQFASDNQKISYLWEYDIENDQREKLAVFPNVKAEGLALNPMRKKLIVVFDRGAKKQSTFVFVDRESPFVNE